MIKQKLINTGRWIKDKVYAGGRWVKRNVKKVLVAAGIIGVALAAGTGTDVPTVPTIDVNGEVISFSYTDDNTGEDIIIRTDSEKTYGITYVMVENKSGTAQDIELSAFFGDERQKVKEVYKLVEDIEKERILPVYETSTQDCSYTNSTTEEFIEKDCVITEKTGTTSETYYIDEWQPQQLKDFSQLSYQDKIIQKKIPVKAKRNFEAKHKIKERINDKSYYKVEISYPLQGEEDYEFFLEAIGSEGAYGHLDPWLGTWTYRQKLTIASSTIDDDLTHFPVTVFFSNTNGSTSEVFNEVGSASTNIAFTTDDEETQLYGEIAEWDESASTAVIHVSKTGWEIASSTDTEFYLYYDSGESANTSYIGNDPDDTPSNNVWDSNYVLVSHPPDTDGSTLKDSTDNSNDSDFNNADSVAGKLAYGVDFNGSSEYVSFPDDNTLDLTTWTYELWVYDKRNSSSWQEMLSKTNSAADGPIFWINETEGSNRYSYRYEDTGGTVRGDLYFDKSAGQNTWYKFVATYDGSTLRIRKDDTQEDAYSTNYTPTTSSGKLYLDSDGSVSYHRFQGTFDEFRVSNIARSDNWLNASYYTQNDDFLTYGAEEETAAPAEENMKVIIISYLWQKNGK